MKKEELNCLQIIKRSEGKSEARIKKEIGDLIQSQNDFKELKKERKQLLKRINFLEEENKKLKDKLFQQGLNPINKKAKENELTGNEKVATIKHLTRILLMLKAENKPLTRTELKEVCCTNAEIIKTAIMFLTKHNLVEDVSIDGARKYIIR